jgi:hypothetical protein
VVARDDAFVDEAAEKGTETEMLEPLLSHVCPPARTQMAALYADSE